MEQERVKLNDIIDMKLISLSRIAQLQNGGIIKGTIEEAFYLFRTNLN